MRLKGLILALVIAAIAGAQTSSAQVVRVLGRGEAIGNTPTPSDMYCGGYITTDHVPTSRYVAAGWDSPDRTRYGGPRDYFYIHGRDLKVGDRYEIVRHVKSPNQYEFYRGESGAIRDAGEPYFELGYAKVIDVQKETGVAVPVLACADFVVGDLAIPFVERTAPVFRVVPPDHFSPPNGKQQGRIIMANEFDSLLGVKYIAYINLGEDKGIKVGDYLRATRTYNYTYHDRDMGLSRYASAVEDTQKTPEKLPLGDLSTLPRITLGNMIVLQVHKKSSTVMITSALRDIHVGDGVELMDVSNAPELQPLAPASSAANAGNPAGTTSPLNMESDTVGGNPPQISCTASPASVRVGESSVITCQASSRDNRPISITFVTNGGKLASSHNQATLDTTDAGAGPIAVRATAFDDRQLSAAATTIVNVEAPLPPISATPQKMTQLEFKPNSAYVDNRSKAILDDVALKLQQDPASTAVLYGAADPSEAARLGAQRADNAKTYLTKSKGIDPQRLQTKPGATPGRTVDVWTVPPGATAPQ
jgi:outer membrane protein OmpA-like peptidoglycan-associated protein